MKKKEEKCDYRITALNKKGETVPAPKQQKLKDEFIRVHIKEHKSPKPEKKCKQITHISLQTKKDINKPTKGVRVEEIEQSVQFRDFGNGVTGNVYIDLPQSVIVEKLNEIIKVLNNYE